MSDGAPTINAVLGQSGACPEIEHAGKVWKVGHPTQEAKVILNGLVVAYASAEIERQEKNLPPAMAAKIFDSFVLKITDRHYQTWHPGWLAIMGGQDGDILFLQSLLRLAHPEATESDARSLHRERGNQVKVALAQVIPPFIDLMEPDLPPQLPPQQRTQLVLDMKAKYRSPQEPTG